LDLRLRNAFLAGAAILVATTVARAQPADPIGDLLLQGIRPEPDRPPSAQQTVERPLSDADRDRLGQALSAAKRGDVSSARSLIADIRDRTARQTATWALVNADGDALTFAEVDQARRELAGWPRAARRQATAEKLIETSGKSPREVVAWFGASEPATPEGAMALASAYRSLGEQQKASDLIRDWWRNKSFEADQQRMMLTRFGGMLTIGDHIRRADILLYGAQGPATHDMVDLLPPDQQVVAQARMALRSDSSSANSAWDALTPDQQTMPGVAFERAAYLRRKGLDTLAISELQYFPRELTTPEQADRIWDERRRLILAAIHDNDWKAAYQAAANSGLTEGADACDAEFYAGWLALTRLDNPTAAARHFAAIEKIGTSPITRGRALYWEGRAAEARGDKVAADTFYRQGAQYTTTFYGQLAAEKLDLPLVLPKDPVPTAAERRRFEDQDMIQATRLLADEGQRDLFRVFALHMDDVVSTPVDAALLVDLIRGYGDQDISMRSARAEAMRGLILADRGYPYRTPPDAPGAPEPALVLGITRQESGFDPMVRSPADARGMMQLLPSTARLVARRIGVSYSASRLNDPDYNMQLGSAYLGQIVDRFSGSYVMGVAGYNAGPGRPAQWTAFCGDPRGGSTDPIDYIECIPFSETRNYVMRVLENMQVYRAKMAGGTAKITLSSDLRRGSYRYAAAQSTAAGGQ
jgi:soluble lytic murein transglycosylase